MVLDKKKFLQGPFFYLLQKGERMEKKTHKYLKYSDRQIIEKGIKNGVRVSEIAKKVGVSRQTIYTEMKRAVPYTAEKAQKSLFQ